MKTWKHIEEFNRIPIAVVTSGTFDGVHLGHQKIISRLKEVSTRISGKTVVLTYWPHPRLVLNPNDTSVKLLNTFSEKEELLKQLEIDHLICIPFTRSFSEMSANEFIKEILVNRIGTKKLVIGYDHHFGKNREGNFEQLSLNAPAFGFEVEEISRQDIDESTISSSAIRKYIQQGLVKLANRLLGRPYSFSGKVVAGEKIGRQLGFPTANLSLEQSNDPDSIYKLIPGEGIYAVKVSVDHDQYNGMLYIGQRPTLGGKSLAIEVNIFDFDRQIYGQTITIELMDLIRGDLKFNSLEELKVQLIKDKENTLEILR